MGATVAVAAAELTTAVAAGRRGGDQGGGRGGSDRGGGFQGGPRGGGGDTVEGAEADCNAEEVEAVAAKYQRRARPAGLTLLELLLALSLSVLRPDGDRHGDRHALSHARRAADQRRRIAASLARPAA